ncbi:MAG: ParB/RepB/Spo0J family partition protein [Alphaproteobacteria bacterium]
MSERDGGEGGRRRGLAKGLSALLGDAGPEVAGASRDAAPHRVPIEFLRPGRLQPRRRFGDDEIRTLADSIRDKGILQPIVVRRDPEVAGSYEIVSGERRWRAAQLAHLHDVPVVVREFSDSEALEVALVENVQREDLTALEEAEGYKRLIDEFGHNQEALGRVVGKSRSHVANTLRLLGLPDPVKELLDEGRLSAGHARALLAAADPGVLAEQVVKRGLNVRQTEKLVRRAAASGARPAPAAEREDADSRAVERRLADRLGLKVKIHRRGAGGRLEIHYSAIEQLDDILRRLGAAD